MADAKLTYSAGDILAAMRGRGRIGRPPGRNITKRFTVAFSMEQYIELNEQAVFEERSMTYVVRKAVDEYLQRRNRGGLHD